MQRTRLLVAICWLLAVWAVGSGFVMAEVSADPSETDVSVIVLGIIEGPDPIPQIIWAPVRDIDPQLYLNAEGSARGDGRPDITFDPVTGWPHVVWAYNNGPGFDIAYSRWDGSGWLATEHLTSSAANEIDPRVFVDTSAVYVVWWEEVSGAVRLVKRQRLGDWGVTEVISGHQGARPSVVSWGGSVLVASEKSDGQGGSDIYVSTRLAQNDYSTEVIGGAPHEQPLNAVLHSEQDKLWIDWQHDATQFAYSEYSAGWATPVMVPLTDDSWLGTEAVRLLIRNEVTAFP